MNQVKRRNSVWPWVVAPPLLLLPILITCQHDFGATAGLGNAILLALWCVALPFSIIRLVRLGRQRPLCGWLILLQFVLNATLLVYFEDAPSVYDQLALVLVAGFAVAGLTGGLRVWRAMKAMDAPLKAYMGLLVAMGLGAAIATALGLSTIKSRWELAHHSPLAGGKRELRIFNLTCMPPDSATECRESRAIVYVCTRGLPVALSKSTLPKTNFQDGHVEERNGRVSIDFGHSGPRFLLDPGTCELQQQ